MSASIPRTFVAHDPGRLLGQAVLSGQCVAYVQVASGAPTTAHWRRGSLVKGDTGLPSGTAIATFDPDGTYGNHTDGRSHAAIYLGQDASGLTVYDQWLRCPVHQRTIRFGGALPVNNGDCFHTIEAAGQPLSGGTDWALPASALVSGPSTGSTPAGLAIDGDRLLKGFDAARDCSAIATRARSSGMDFVIRYYSNNGAKNLHAAEAKALSRAGLRIAAVWEAAGNLYGSFSYAQGVADAAKAHLQAVAVGQANGSTIYFGVDFPATDEQVSHGITAYFNGVAAGFSTATGGDPSFEVGVYGCGTVCDGMKRQGLATRTWLAGASAWPGSRDYDDWNIKQSVPQHFLGFDVDPDQARPGFGDFAVA